MFPSVALSHVVTRRYQFTRHAPIECRNPQKKPVQEVRSPAHCGRDCRPISAFSLRKSLEGARTVLAVDRSGEKSPDRWEWQKRLVELSRSVRQIVGTTFGPECHLRSIRAERHRCWIKNASRT